MSVSSMRVILSFSLLIRICRCRCLPRTFALLCLYDYYVDFLLYLNYSADKDQMFLTPDIY